MKKTEKTTLSKKTQFTSYSSELDNLNNNNPLSPPTASYNVHYFFPDLSSNTNHFIDSPEHELMSAENDKPEHGVYKTIYELRKKQYDPEERNKIVDSFLNI